MLSCKLNVADFAAVVQCVPPFVLHFNKDLEHEGICLISSNVYRRQCYLSHQYFKLSPQ